MQLVQTEKAHRRQHQDSITRTEVTTVHRGEELKNHGAAPPQPHWFVIDRSESQSPVDQAVRHEKERGEENQERYEAREYTRWRANQEQRAERATDDADQAQSKQDCGTVFEFSAIAKESAEESGPKGDGAGPVCDARIESEPDQNRKGQQRSSTGNRINDARSKRGAQHDKPGEETHRGGRIGRSKLQSCGHKAQAQRGNMGNVYTHKEAQKGHKNECVNHL